MLDRESIASAWNPDGENRCGRVSSALMTGGLTFPLTIAPGNDAVSTETEATQRRVGISVVCAHSYSESRPKAKPRENKLLILMHCCSAILDSCICTGIFSFMEMFWQ